ncbi:MAG: universal stress protein [Acidobacteriota bacterium]
MTILVPTDFSACSEVALRQAMAFARRDGGTLHIVHVMPSFENNPYIPMQSGEWGAFFVQQEENARDLLEEWIGKFDTEGLDVERHLPLGAAAAPAILGLAEEIGAELIVVGAYGRRGFRRLFFGSVTQEIVRHAECAVLTVRESAEPIIKEWPDRILVPVDLSAPCEHALKAVPTMAGPGTRIDLVHVIDLLNTLPVAAGAVGLSFPEARANADGAVRRFIAETDGGPDLDAGHVTFEIIEGRPAEALAEYAAERGVDLLVIATHGLSGLNRLLLGSVTERLLRQVDCPVLTLRADTA